MLKFYKKEVDLLVEEEKEKEIFSHQRPKSRYFLCLPKLVRNIILGIAILICFLYLGYRVKGIIAPPLLEIYFPPDNYIAGEMKIEIYGRSEKEVSIFINKEEIIANKEGYFRHEVNLKEGMNIIRVRGEKKYGRDVEAVRQVLAK